MLIYAHKKTCDLNNKNYGSYLNFIMAWCGTWKGTRTIYGMHTLELNNIWNNFCIETHWQYFSFFEAKGANDSNKSQNICNLRRCFPQRRKADSGSCRCWGPSSEWHWRFHLTQTHCEANYRLLILLWWICILWKSQKTRARFALLNHDRTWWSYVEEKQTQLPPNITAGPQSKCSKAGQKLEHLVPINSATCFCLFFWCTDFILRSFGVAIQISLLNIFMFKS